MYKGGSRVLKECIIKEVKNFDHWIWVNVWFPEGKMAIVGNFVGNIVLSWFISLLSILMFSLGIFDWHFTYEETDLLIYTSKMCRNTCRRMIILNKDTGQWPVSFLKMPFLDRYFLHILLIKTNKSNTITCTIENEIMHAILSANGASSDWDAEMNVCCI